MMVMCIKVHGNFLTLCNLRFTSNKRLHPNENNALAFPAMETGRNNLYSLSKLNGCVIHD